MKPILRYLTLLLTICILATACQKDEHPGGGSNTTPEQTLIFEDSQIGLDAAQASGAPYFKVELEF